MKPQSSQPHQPTWPEAGMLIDAHFDELTEMEGKALESSMARKPGLQRCRTRLAQLLEPLKQWTVPPATQQLADKVIARVAMSGGDSHAHGWVVHQGGGRQRGFFLNWQELGAIAACLAVFVGVGTLTFSSSRSNAQRLMCGGNLRDIYSGTAMYAASFGGQLPFAGTSPDGYWLRNTAAQSPMISNSSHQYLLLQSGFVPKPESFVCAARLFDAAISRDEITKYYDFPAQNMCSYDAQNMTGPFVSLFFGRRTPYQSDANPLFDGAVTGANPQAGNSRSHNFKGQNVLFSDGSVIFARSPIVGKDNIWQAGTLVRYQGNEAPTCQSDAFMVPGAKRESDL